MFNNSRFVIRQSFLAASILLSGSIFEISAQKVQFAGETRLRAYQIRDRMPDWTSGFLVPIENNDLTTPVLHPIDDTGTEALPIVFSIAGAKSMRIEHIARGPDGTYALCGRAFDQEGKGGGFVSWISPDRQKVITDRVFPYVPMHVTITPDGTTWTQGWEIANHSEEDPSVNRRNGVIRRFDRSGKLIGSYIPRWNLTAIPSVAMQDGHLASNQDRIGWYLNVSHLYFELTFKGDKVTPNPIPYPGLGQRNERTTRVNGLAMMENGDVYISLGQHGSRLVTQLYRLDRASRTWVPVDTPLNSDGTAIVRHPVIMGADGKKLALLGGEGVVYVKPGN